MVNYTKIVNTILTNHGTTYYLNIVRLDGVEYFPYFENSYLAVAASLNGGNVLDFFVKSVLNWVSALGLNITEGKLYSKQMINIICKHDWVLDELWNRMFNLPSENHLIPLIVNPLMSSERHNPKTYGSIINVTNDNFTLAELFSGFSKGIVHNLLK